MVSRSSFQKLVIHTIGEDPNRIVNRLQNQNSDVRRLYVSKKEWENFVASRVLGRCDIVSAVRAPLRFFRGKNGFCVHCVTN